MDSAVRRRNLAERKETDDFIRVFEGAPMEGAVHRGTKLKSSVRWEQPADCSREILEVQSHDDSPFLSALSVFWRPQNLVLQFVSSLKVQVMVILYRLFVEGSVWIKNVSLRGDIGGVSMPSSLSLESRSHQNVNWSLVWLFGDSNRKGHDFPPRDLIALGICPLCLFLITQPRHQMTPGKPQCREVIEVSDSSDCEDSIRKLVSHPIQIFIKTLTGKSITPLPLFEKLTFSAHVYCPAFRDHVQYQIQNSWWR